MWFLLLGTLRVKDRGNVEDLFISSYLYFDLKNSLGNWLRHVFTIFLHFSGDYKMMCSVLRSGDGIECVLTCFAGTGAVKIC